MPDMGRLPLRTPSWNSTNEYSRLPQLPRPTAAILYGILRKWLPERLKSPLSLLFCNRKECRNRRIVSLFLKPKKNQKEARAEKKNS